MAGDGGCGFRAGGACCESTSASFDAGRFREKRRTAVPVELAAGGLASAAELLPFLTPSWEKGFWVVEALAGDDAAAAALEVEADAAESGASGIFDVTGEDEEGLEAS